MLAFAELFETEPEVTADAPGRVNLIGEHTDYNGGFVLPTAIPQRTRVALARRGGNRVRVASAAFCDHDGAPEVHQFELGAESPGRGWLDYVQGVTSTLASAGHQIAGFDATIQSEVPLGSGLSSSAALAVSLLRALRQAFSLSLDDVVLALLGQRAENELAGARVGIMDQLAASLADETTALLIDTRSLAIERVPLPADADLVVLHSGVSHANASSGYNLRRDECERAARWLGVEQLRDVETSDLDRVESLPEPLGRRARHVVTENHRVLDAVEALRRSDLSCFGELLYASHASLRDDYQVSTPEIDLIVELAKAEPDVLGARITGGGFGGSVVMLTRRGTGREVSERIARLYEERSRLCARVLVPLAS